MRAVLADHPDEKTISLLAISVSHLEEHWDFELELPLGLKDEAAPPLFAANDIREAVACAICCAARSSRIPHRLPIASPQHVFLL